MEDTLIPCKEIGLTFKHGDILQVSFKLSVFIKSFYFYSNKIVFDII